MPAHKTPGKVLLRTKDVVEACLREGYAPPEMGSRGRAAHKEAATRLAEEFGCAEDTAWGWITRINRSDEYRPDYSIYRPFQYQTFKDQKMVGKSRQLTPDRAGQRVALIGDMHDSPNIPDKSRFYWIGRWAASNSFDQIIQVGDMFTLDSLTRHAAPGTKTFADLPSYKQDLDSGREALSEFDRGFRDGLAEREASHLDEEAPKKVITLGNHEDRAKRYEDANPQMANLIHNQLLFLFEEFGWEVIPYQEWYMVEGVAVTHHVTNSVGRAYGGKTADQRASNDTCVSVIHGHTHQRHLYTAPKVGPIGSIEMVSVGCALPWGVIEEYAKHGPGGWWWGACSAHLVQGQIATFNSISMLDLEDQYSESV